MLFLNLQSEEREPDIFHRHKDQSSSDFANRLRDTYFSIAEHNSTIPNHFKKLGIADTAICEIASVLDQISFRAVSFDVKGLAYEEVIKNTFDKNDNQQFFTPSQVVKFTVEMPHPELHYDAILTNPPFGSDLTDEVLLQSFKLGRRRNSRRRGIPFLERCHQFLKKRRMLAFIIDGGVLNGNSAEEALRLLTQNFQVDAIVSLPDTAFIP